MTNGLRRAPLAAFLELRSIPWLERVETTTLQVVAQQLERVSARADSVLSAADDVVDRVLLVRTGALSIGNSDGYRRATVEHPIALLHALAGRDSDLTIVAELDSELFAIHIEAFWEALEEDFGLMALAIELLAGVLADGRAHHPLPRSPELVSEKDPDLVRQILWLRSTRALARAPVRSVGALAKRSGVRDLSGGVTVFGKGEVSRAMFFVLSGVVREGGRLHLPGALVGELEAFAGRARSADCRAIEASRLLWLDVETVWDVLEDDFALARYLLARLALGVLRLTTPTGPAPAR